jgi:hypothetical protein
MFTTDASTIWVVVASGVEVEMPYVDFEGALEAAVALDDEPIEIDAHGLEPMDTDVIVAASTVLGHLSTILEHREEIARTVRHIDKLSDYAKATWLAYVATQPASFSLEEPSVAAEVSRLRSTFLPHARVFALDGPFDPAAVAKIRDGSAHRHAAGDLVALVELFREHWRAISHRTRLTADDLTRGAELADAAIAMAGRRKWLRPPIQGGEGLAARRAWTRLYRAYSEARRALDVLRRSHGDADLIAPNLRRNRS